MPSTTVTCWRLPSPANNHTVPTVFSPWKAQFPQRLDSQIYSTLIEVMTLLVFSQVQGEAPSLRVGSNWHLAQSLVLQQKRRRARIDSLSNLTFYLMLKPSKAGVQVLGDKTPVFQTPFRFDALCLLFDTEYGESWSCFE